jgi:hypothetical protein
LPHDHGNTVNGLETIRRSISYSLAKSAWLTTRPALQQALGRDRIHYTC